MPCLSQFSSARQLRDDEKNKIETTQYYEQNFKASFISEHTYFAVCSRVPLFSSPQAELVFLSNLSYIFWLLSVFILEVFWMIA